MTLNDADLRAFMERKRTGCGLPADDTPPQAVALPCKTCGRPIACPRPHDARTVRAWNALAGMAPRFSCPACLAADRKRLRQAQADSERAARERALAAVRADLPGALARCGVPEHWQAATLDNCPDLPAKLVEAARKWAAAPEGMVYLFGPPGAGKSWLAVAMLRAVLESGRLSPADCLYVGERSYLDRLRATFNGAHVSPRLLPANHPCRVALLLFDDLGASRLTDWGKGEIAGLIEGRHADGLPTICTSNLDPAQLAQAVDARVASRIAESGRMYVFPSRDFRIVGVLSKRARPGARIQNGE